MSLIGSLEDLNLGDILQIIYLSQKSGILVIRSGEGEGRIVFRDGLVCGGTTKGGPADLRGLLLASGLIEAAAFDAARDACANPAADLDGELVRRELIGAEQLDCARRESVEVAVHEMFRWETGEFSFDLQRESDAEGSDLRLGRGINPQFLAMERVRLDDESGRNSEFEEEDPNEMSAEEMFGVVSDDPDSLPEVGPTAIATDDPVDALAQLTAAKIDESDDAEPLETDESDDAELLKAGEFADAGDDFDDDDALLEVDLLEPSSSFLDADARSSERIAQAGEPVAPSPAFAIETRSAPIIVIDVDLVALEWTKHTLEGAIEKVHIFQRCELGLTRIRQYLARAITPMVLVSPQTPGDPSGGIRNAAEFVKRLKGQAPGMTVLWLCEQGAEGPPASSMADGRLTRPATRDFRSPAAAKSLDALAHGLREDLFKLTGVVSSKTVGRSAAAVAGGGSGGSEPQDITRALGGTSSRGEILPLVIRFARESFARVAMFIVRDGSVMGIAQSGLDTCGGPDDHGMRGINLEGEECAWLREVLSSSHPRLAGPSDHGDYKLAALLGDRAADEAYVAPLESDGQIVALLYADNLPGTAPIVDTSLVDEALRQAGRALDRAVLIRTQEDDPLFR